ncbi:MAG: hypothetical protein D6741_20520 [Planctomycetota bacterium]|nr:MAG: hypothetical protein D6741_20520 [Planctomycetota bacterium]
MSFVDGNIHRQFVEWENGTRVWVNRGNDDWTVNDHILPSYGFLAIGRSQNGPWSAAIERRNGLITEICKTPQSIYVNGRKPYRNRFPAEAVVRGLRDLGDGKFQLDLQWDCDRPVPAEYRPFLHLCDDQGEIVFQAQHQPNVFDGTRSGRFGAAAFGIVPEERRTTAGRYELRIGFYRPDGGRRLDIEGVQDGEHRTRLGTLVVTPGEHGPQLAWEPLSPQADPYEQRINPTGKPLDFGCIVTAGALKLERTGDTLVATPLPTPPDAATEFQLVWDAIPWTVPPCSRIDYLDASGNVLQTEHRSPIAGRLQVSIPGTVFAVRLSP